ncbi:MAG: FAD-dependent oxidoreductase [Pseudomonadota bacterium]
MNTIKTELIVIGAGSGGLSVAAGAAQMGKDVTLFEKGKMGGDCLNYGCVPSKSLIAAASRAHAMAHPGVFGIGPVAPEIDFAAVNAHVHQVIAAIEPHDSQERFEGFGVKVVREAAAFSGKRTVVAGDTQYEAKHIVVSTGSRAAIPPIPGLETVPYLTNETVFNLTERPDHLIVIGGGPIGVELGQAHRRLGSDVTLIEGFKVMGKDDPELVAVVLEAIKADGIDVREGAKVASVSGEAGAITVTLEGGETVNGSHLLLAAGRQPNVDGLNLEAAGIAYTKQGISVDGRLRTSNSRVYAIGDVAGGLQFTHVAGYHAGIAVRNILFKVPAKADTSAIPWVTYTDPELAHVGMTEAEARKAYGDKATVVRWALDENDRAQAERDTRGFIKAVIGPGGRIKGASIVGAKAGELIQPWVLALSQKLKISAFTGMVAPYPTRGEIGKRAAGAYYTPVLFSQRTQNIVRLLGVFD